jgi:hypothetical protein
MDQIPKGGERQGVKTCGIDIEQDR